ncbi:nitrate/sulfonate/bicarbonate ABC transporter ATP-binding protein [Pseudomonas sp. RTC3]|uniref:ABC transporter ATP-binding protein n=2 Tax=Pseudomonas TaxID=286 RepID=UPI002AB34883|nr:MULTISPECIES: nitrate/sulfonate/bicarbonate ABC transporter ATP-binding protein [unclassified Pseudomonas]MEB0064374.1 nitrate/sulfonate/bicarbonate ABC transporter ATP-binding protein [Pseudomonas sp. RTC3]MDY7566796.1 nitrate/sulfonate/bicarbonate ABC transporter ATP-binding protein [Pseudomonas sp. 5C2]MEB0006790.1 nitrate/sulfonate/bicarbonate ABC transporter ATP-binding protein [Pseudomonas sp. RTB2]MEB0016306.1 nitrate/sulfonate/bicarbonate ABC transporter ATP-binding protein [Pseudomo
MNTYTEQASAAPEIYSLNDVSRAFGKGKDELQVLSGVDLTLREGEIVGMLGRSGSGKSTLLRIIAGLIQPSSGEVRYNGSLLTGPAEGVAMVFQTFALFPWLTVLENVEAGLQALQVEPKAARKRALDAIDLIGLDGFENAYPRELSGGMRQRVGFARGLVVNPTLLLMDEPFSALDVLTAETLRSDLLDLWSGKQLPIKSILIVTHNIEEAVLMCDRVLVLSSNPGRVVAEIKVPFVHPRNRLDPTFRKMVDDIYALMTNRRSADASTGKAELQMGSPLPDVSTNLMAGLIEALAAEPYHGHAGLPNVSERLLLEVDDLFPVAEMLEHLGFAELKGAEITLTEAGKLFAEYGTQERKTIFAEHLVKHVPLAARIRQVLQERHGHWAPRVRFEQELEDSLSGSFVEETLESVISWGRYAEIFSYNDNTETFSLEDVEGSQ